MKKVITIITVIATVFTFATPANADWIQATSSLTETEFDNLVTSNAVTSAFVFRAGGTGGGEYELSADSGREDNVIWNFDFDNDITLDFTEAGALEMSANGSSIVYERPASWFNTIIISISHIGTPFSLEDLSFEGININGEGSISLNAPNLGDRDAVRIDLSSHGDGKQYPFTLKGNLIPVDAFGGAVADQFHGEIYFLQTEAIPEPGAMALVIIGGVSILFIRRIPRRRRRW